MRASGNDVMSSLCRWSSSGLTGNRSDITVKEQVEIQYGGTPNRQNRSNMWSRIVFLAKRLQERLWVRPLMSCVLSVVAAFLAKAADSLNLDGRIPSISPESIETLLSITAGSMLVIATLAVTSMVSAYAAASSTATPRSFSLLVSDDLSQNALSTFLGAFIFTFVALVALKNDFYGKNGLFLLFVMTVIVVAFVIVVFVRWVDWIARLGRIGTTVDKVESAGVKAFTRNRLSRRLGGTAIEPGLNEDNPVFSDTTGYVQHVNVEALQEFACRHQIRITLSGVPGVFIAPGRALAYLHFDEDPESSLDVSALVEAFDIGDSRVYDDDPRFALVALSEIASRALSPAVNDPGTAITIFGSFIRLFSIYAKPLSDGEEADVRFDRILVEELSVEEMIDDAFRAIARDGAPLVEVQIRLQKALRAIAELHDAQLTEAARKQSRAALTRAKKALEFEPDFDLVDYAAEWSK